MLVRDRMSSPLVTVTPEMPFQHALKLMHERRLRRLPVTDTEGKLVGIVAERDLLYASASPATSLSVWELNYLLSKLKIRELMTKEVIGSEFHSRESYRFIPKPPYKTSEVWWNFPLRQTARRNYWRFVWDRACRL